VADTCPGAAVPFLVPARGIYSAMDLLTLPDAIFIRIPKKATGSPYSITERRVTEPIPVLGSQPAGDASHKPGGRLPLLSARPTVTLATLKRAATYFAGW